MPKLTGSGAWPRPVKVGPCPGSTFPPARPLSRSSGSVGRCGSGIGCSCPGPPRFGPTARSTPTRRSRRAAVSRSSSMPCTRRAPGRQTWSGPGSYLTDVAYADAVGRAHGRGLRPGAAGFDHGRGRWTARRAMEGRDRGRGDVPPLPTAQTQPRAEKVSHEAGLTGLVTGHSPAGPCLRRIRGSRSRG